MYAGQQASKDGYQYCLFPLDVMDCTQVSGQDSYSHCCGHPCDFIGTYQHYPYYAPCDCTRIWVYEPNGESIYTSDNKVWTPSGLTYVSFMFAHDNNIPAATHFNQGDLIGHTGTKGAAGDHVHLDQSLVHNDRLIQYGITCPVYGNDCWALERSAYAYNVFYLGGTEQIIDNKNMIFQTIPAGPEPPEPWEPPDVPVGGEGTLSTAMLLLLYKYRKRRLNNGKRIIRL